MRGDGDGRGGRCVRCRKRDEGVLVGMLGLVGQGSTQLMHQSLQSVVERFKGTRWGRGEQGGGGDVKVGGRVC